MFDRTQIANHLATTVGGYYASIECVNNVNLQFGSNVECIAGLQAIHDSISTSTTSTTSVTTSTTTVADSTTSATTVTASGSTSTSRFDGLQYNEQGVVVDLGCGKYGATQSDATIAIAALAAEKGSTVECWCGAGDIVSLASQSSSCLHYSSGVLARL